MTESEVLKDSHNLTRVPTSNRCYRHHKFDTLRLFLHQFVVYKQPKPKPRYFGEGKLHMYFPQRRTQLSGTSCSETRWPAAMVQATGVRLSPAIDREE